MWTLILGAYLYVETVHAQNGSWPVPLYNVGHAAESCRPGEPCNIILFGHQSYKGKPGVFHNLGDLKVGDEITLDFHSYKVVGSVVVEPNDLEWIYPGNHERLTLITCWPPGQTSKRLIVVAFPERSVN